MMSVRLFYKDIWWTLILQTHKVVCHLSSNEKKPYDYVFILH